MKKLRQNVTVLLLLLSIIIGMVGMHSTAYANSTDLSAFPSSYHPYIQALINQHPNWVFEPYNTGVDWDELVAYQADKDRNLIDKTGNPERYFSKAEGDYNASTDTYIGKSGPNWVTPKNEVIKHYLDPRNFINDSDVFMFLKLDFNENVHTAANVDTLLKGTWMYNKKLEDDSSMTYAQAFVKSGKETSVSSFFLAARVRQENGSGNSALISGTYPGYEGYYNYFNHGAYGSTEAEIIVSGLKSAKQNGWNTRYKALHGGAETLATRYIARNQYNLYFQKFDVVNGISYHQYMQNIQAPLWEGWTMRKAYKDVGLLDESYVFSVPVYKNMPSAACPLPGETVITPPPVSLATPTPDIKLPPTATVTAGTADKSKGTMTVKISDVVSESGGEEIEVRAYSSANGADDLKSYKAVLNSDGSYTATIDIANHGDVRGKYEIEVYISDNTYYEEFVGSVSMTISELSKPVLTIVQYQKTLKIKLSNIDSSYNVSKVSFPVWSKENGQDDLIWYPGVYENGYWVCTVNLAVHKGTDLLINVHAYMTEGGTQSFVSGKQVKIRKTDPLWGDVNYDGSVNAADALEVLKGASGMRTLNDDEKAAADVNFDGNYNAMDALLILKTAAGMTTLPEITW